MVRSDRLFGSEGARSSDVVFFQRGILIAVASVTVTEAGGGSAGTGKHSLPLILARELAANLATPMFLIDADGMLVYFNEAAELMLGRSFGEVGPMSGNEFGSALQLAELDGTPMRRRDSPAAWRSCGGSPPTEAYWRLRSMGHAGRSR